MLSSAEIASQGASLPPAEEEDVAGLRHGGELRAEKLGRVDVRQVELHMAARFVWHGRVRGGEPSSRRGRREVSLKSAPDSISVLSRRIARAPRGRRPDADYYGAHPK